MLCNFWLRRAKVNRAFSLLIEICDHLQVYSYDGAPRGNVSVRLLLFLASQKSYIFTLSSLIKVDGFRIKLFLFIFIDLISKAWMKEELEAVISCIFENVS